MVDADTRHPVPIGNRWDLLDAPELGRWTPTARLSVVIPHYQAVGALERTLASLAAQTYPKDLLEVVVVDDGSDPPLELPDAAGAAWSGLEVRVLHQEDLGFGLARARHNGALAATGSILVFLDADMLCEPRHLEAHARWHHLTDLAVTLGERQHVPADEDHPLPPAEAVRAAAEAGGLETLLGTLPRQRPTWLDHHWQRTDRLTSDHDDLYRAMAGGNLGVSRNRYLDVGGFDVTFTQWGSEDTDLGHRLFLAGGLLVHEPEAACWHQGDTGGLEDHERHSLEEQRARLAQTIAHPRFRRIVPGRTYRVPWLLVEVWAGTEHPEAGTPVTEDLPTYDAVLATVEDVLASDVTDLAVHLHLPATHPDARRLGRQLAGDGRVVLEPVSDHRWSPYRIGLPAGVRLAPTSLRRLVERTGGGRLEYGLVTVHVDGLPDRTVELALARAIERARACGATTADEVRMLAEAAFGRVEVDGAEVELRWKPDSELRTIRRVRPLRLESTARTKRRSPAAPAFPAAQGAERSQVAAWQVLDSPVGWRDRGAAAEAVRAAQDAAATARRKELEVRDRLERLRERRVVQVTDAIGATVGGRATLRSLPARLRAALERAEPDVRSVTPPPAPPAGDGPEEPPAAPTSTGGRPGTAGPRGGGSQELSRDRPGRRSGSAGIGGQDRQELSRDRTRRDGMPHLRVLHLGVVSRFADLVDHVAVPAVGWQEVLRAGGDLL
ncbi:MAG: glycosyltransferase, partial [Nitriliruptoraceae bacterium]